MRVTVGDSGFCCCVFITYFERQLTPLCVDAVPCLHSVGSYRIRPVLALRRTCNDCRQDLDCGYCYIDLNDAVANATCLPTTYDNPWTATIGRCNSSELPGQLTWAYDYCPTPYSWMPMVGLVLYLVFFAPGTCRQTSSTPFSVILHPLK